jgi:flagella basal body P-ring formation protein FlgA
MILNFKGADRVFLKLLAIIALATFPQSALAAGGADASGAGDQLSGMLRREISKQYPGANIGIEKDFHWTRGQLPENFENVSIQGESARGELMFAVTNTDTQRESTGWVGFSAWVPAWVAVHRVHPGEKLTSEMFTRRDINVATGQAREYRGVILEPETRLAGLEARQSVLEGQFLTSSAVQRTPDIRRGDAVRVQLISNGLSLSTLGTAEESAYIDGNVRIMASKTKRELLGKLLPGGIVEVKL